MPTETRIRSSRSSTTPMPEEYSAATIDSSTVTDCETFNTSDESSFVVLRKRPGAVVSTQIQTREQRDREVRARIRKYLSE